MKHVFVVVLALACFFAGAIESNAQLYTSSWVANVPLFSVNAGDIDLDSNNWAVVWGGNVTPNGRYFDVRMVGYNAGMLVRGQMYDREVGISDQDSLTFNINGSTLVVAYKDKFNKPEFNISERCQDSLTCRAWGFSYTIPWSFFGGKPLQGTVWDGMITFNGTDQGVNVSGQSSWQGKIRWGLPNYRGMDVSGAQKITVPLSKDANLGGSTDCGSADYPNYFYTTIMPTPTGAIGDTGSGWGQRNYENFVYVPDVGYVDKFKYYSLVQNQWDPADWPCYAKQIMSWQISAIPANGIITKAIVNKTHFGDPGYGTCYKDDATKDTVHQIYDIEGSYIESSVTWDNAPLPRENTAWELVPPVRNLCSEEVVLSNGTYDKLRQFDVTEIVKRAKAENRSTASMLMYTGAGQYHSGKQFYSGGTVDIYYVLTGITITPTPTPAPVLVPSTIQAEAYISSKGFIKVKDIVGGGKKIFSIQAPVLYNNQYNPSSTSYEIIVPANGIYTFSPRISSKTPQTEVWPNNIPMQLDVVIGSNRLIFNPTQTATWDTFINMSGKTMNLMAGTYSMTLEYKTTGYDVDSVVITSSTTSPTVTNPPLTVTPTNTPISPTPTPKPGDVDGNGVVNIADLTIVLSNFNTSGKTRQQGDLTGDGKVTMSDLIVLLSNFGTTAI